MLHSVTFLLLMVLDHTDDTISYLQIDRNTMVDVPYIGVDGNGEGENFEQICTASWYGNLILSLGSLFCSPLLPFYYIKTNRPR